MKKHLIPDHTALPRLPYRLLQESWWMEEDVTNDDRIPSQSIIQNSVRRLLPHLREVSTCN
jgi:hypothetical protein